MLQNYPAYGDVFEDDLKALFKFRESGEVSHKNTTALETIFDWLIVSALVAATSIPDTPHTVLHS